MAYTRTLAALRDQADRSWAVADALAAELATGETGRVLNGEFTRCREWLSEQGYEVTVSYLRTMRDTAVKFPPLEGRRRWRVPFRFYVAAGQSPKWTEELMTRAEDEHLTLRQFSEIMTGKRWADDDLEATRRVLGDMSQLAITAGEMDTEELARLLAALQEAYDGKVAEGLKSAGVEGGKIRLPETRSPLTVWSLTEFDLDILRIEQDLRKYARLLSELETPIPSAYKADMVAAAESMRISLDYIESAVRRETADWDAAAFTELGEVHD